MSAAARGRSWSPRLVAASRSPAVGEPRAAAPTGPSSASPRLVTTWARPRPVETSIFTLSYTVALAVELALPTINFPFAMFSSATEIFWAALPDDFEAVAACLFAPPRLEKFHVPVGVFSSVICGSWRVIPVMFSCLEKISGITSTPTFSDLAVINGDLLNLGSSAIAIFSASTLPDSRERLRLPTVTWRPSASVSSDSIFGRKLFTLIRKGSATRITRRTATTIPTIFRIFISCSCFPGVMCAAGLVAMVVQMPECIWIRRQVYQKTGCFAARVNPRVSGARFPERLRALPVPVGASPACHCSSRSTDPVRACPLRCAPV